MDLGGVFCFWLQVSLHSLHFLRLLPLSLLAGGMDTVCCSLIEKKKERNWLAGFCMSS